MTETLQFADDADLDGPLKTAVEAIRSEPAPSTAVDRLRERVRQTGVASVRRHKASQNRMIRCLSVAAAIAVLAVAAIWATGIGGRRMAIAEVVAAMGGRPWIRVTTAGNDLTERVWWYSPQKNISASRNGKSIEYHDHALGVYYSYDVEEKVLYRSPEFTPRRSSRYETLTAALQTLLDDEQLSDDPLKQMEFLGRERANMELVDQSLEQVEEAGQAWLDYQLTLRHREREEGFTLVFRVDPETKLPQSYRMEGRWNGTQGVETARFEFPDEGPADVYDMGVPRTAELVDRVPTDDVQRIVNNLRVGRHRMDNYRAIVVSHMGANDDASWDMDRPLVLYRKGDKFRADRAGFRGRWPQIDGPTDDTDMDAWWKKRADDFLYAPVYVVRGTTTHHITLRESKNGAGENGWIVQSVKDWDTNTVPGEMYPPYWSRRPEFVCRPPMGIGRQDLEVSLESGPQDEEKQLARLSVKATEQTRQPVGRPAMPDLYEYWLDPSRGHAAVLWESGGTRHVIEELAVSPGGVWYATRFRHVATGPNNELIEEVFHIFVDFDAELPDSLFEIPKVGQTY